MKNILLHFAIFLFVNSAITQTLNWEYFPYEGKFDVYNSGIQILVDSEGNFYTIGHFKEYAAINGDTLAVAGSNSDILIVKYKPDHTIEWYKELDLNIYPRYFEAALDGQENLMLAGEYEGSFQLDGLFLSSEPEQSAFITKISKDGQTLWLRSVLDGYPAIHAMSLDEYDNIYISGDGWNGGFFSMLDANGNVLWLWNINSPGGGNNVWGADIKKALDGSVYGLLLWQSNSINVTNNLTLYNPYSWGIQITLFKFNNTGEIIWYEQNKEGRLNENAYLAIDGESNAYVAGNFHNAPLKLGNLSLPMPDQNHVFGFLAKCNANKEWEWLYQRDPFPNLSKSMIFDCMHEFLYAVGSSSLEVYDKTGNQVKQKLFNSNLIRPSFIDIGADKNLLLCGYTFLGSLNDENSTGSFHPFVADMDYEWDLIPLPPAPVTNPKVIRCPGTLSVSLTAEGTNLSWYQSPDFNTVISSESSLEVSDPGSAIFYVSQQKEGCEGKRAKVELIDLGDLSLDLIHDTLFTRYDSDFAYSWELNDEIIPGANAHFLPVDSNGTYTVSIEVENCLTQLDYFYQPSFVSTLFIQDLKIHPAIFNEYVEIEWTPKEKEVQLVVYNAMGQSVKAQIMHFNYHQKVKLPTAEFQSGIYFFTLYTSKGSFSKKLIKP